MKTVMIIALGTLMIFGCSDRSEKLQINGTWRLITGTIVKQGDTTVTDYTKGQEFIKIINASHFAFMKHDLNKGQDSTAVYVAGGGTYDFDGSNYVEHLMFLNYREWEGNDFEFVMTMSGDTLIQTGREEIESLGVSQLNIEKYVKEK
ncbi:MAG: hypothetical protein OCD76_00290 [Reichenbachiella sp.]